MVDLHKRRARWGLRLAAGLALGSGVVLTTTAGAAGPEPEARQESFDARAVFRAFQDLAEAVQKEEAEAIRQNAKGLDGVLKTLNRPERSVTAPALTASRIDAMLDRALAESKAMPARVTSDEEFLRRVSLDVIGKPPTPEQVRAFVQNTDKNKRAKLIDRLLDSPDYGANWARYWRDVISYHATNQVVRLIGYDDLETWLAAQFNQNRPWDAIATDLITANGTSEENGAVAFLLSHADQQRIPAVEVAGEVSRIFMGVQIQCAQCHDHPSDSWTRAQFHQFAAFFDGPRARRRGVMVPPEVVTLGRAELPDARPGGPEPPDPGRSPILPGHLRDPGAEGPHGPAAPGAGGVVRHRAGQPLVRPRVRQPGLDGPPGRRVLQPGR